MHQRARAALGHLAQRDAEVASLSVLERELAEANRLADRQRAAFAKARCRGRRVTRTPNDSLTTTSSLPLDGSRGRR
jgi:hypothetical protein